MLKQARAFGVGMLLATQNPVDLDYKGLSNTGTWFIGKLQTEWDKQRLLDGLQAADGSLNRSGFDKIISALGKREFILHNIHAKQPVIFQSRWAMNYLAGPLTRTQIGALNQLKGIAPSSGTNAPSPATDLWASSAAPAPASATSTDFATIQPVRVADAPPAAPNTRHTHTATASETRPPLPSAIPEYFLPLNYSLVEAFRAAGEPMSPHVRQQHVVYRPMLVAMAQIRFLDRRMGVDSQLLRMALIEKPERMTQHWENHPYDGPTAEEFDPAPAPGALFELVPGVLSDARWIAAAKKDFTDWIFTTTRLTVRANTTLKVYAGSETSAAEFRTRCAEAARAGRDAESAKLSATYERQLTTLRNRLTREERELEMDLTRLEHRSTERNVTHLGNAFNFLRGKPSISRLGTSVSRHRLTEQARSQVIESEKAIAQFAEQIKALEAERDQKIAEIHERWAGIANQVSETALVPTRTNIFVRVFGVAWAPYYVLEEAGKTFELPAFGAE
jgi:hypothetical protein